MTPHPPTANRTRRLNLPAAALIAAEVLLLWLVLTAGAFRFDGYLLNEVDVLPSARQAADPAWLPNDWYLNLDVRYRALFNRLLGLLLAQVGFAGGAVLGRLIGYLCCAVALVALARALRLPHSGLLITGYVYCRHQSLIAGEWMLGGVETKTLAYALVLLGLALLLRRRYLAMWAALGAALSFHVLIGLYALLCTVGALLAVGAPRRRSLAEALARAWPYPLTAAGGLWAIAQQLTQAGAPGAAEAWRIYVYYRVPHHLLPQSWTYPWWPLKLALAAAMLVALYWAARRPSWRPLAAYGLISAGLFGVGLLAARLDQTALLRFYWFRFPDVILPLLGLLGLGLFLGEAAEGGWAQALGAGREAQAAALTRVTWAGLRVGAAAVLLLASATLYRGLPQTARWLAGGSGGDAITGWIAANTPREATFLVDPTEESFYLTAERAMFVSFKHAPQSAGNVLEWYERLTRCNGGIPPQRRGSNALEPLREGYARLDAEQITRLARDYGLDYYLGREDPALPLRAVYTAAGRTLYALGE